MHNDACFVFVEKGSKSVYTGLEKLEVGESESILMKCGHYIVDFAVDRSKKQFSNIVFHLHPEVIQSLLSAESIKLKGTQSMAETKAALKFNPNALLDHYVKGIRYLLETNQSLSEPLLRLKYKELVLILLETDHTSMVKAILSSLYSPRKAAFDEVIQFHLYHNLGIQELAILTHRSETTFKRDFKKWYGKSPARYLREAKLKKATELLKTQDMPISQIAWECGFNDLANFNRTFRKQFNCSPTEFKSARLAKKPV